MRYYLATVRGNYKDTFEEITREEADRLASQLPGTEWSDYLIGAEYEAMENGSADIELGPLQGIIVRKD